jgi:branched-chain amino acid transport system ATP-binding protein
MTPSAALSCDGLSAGYGPLTVVRGLDLTVDAGEVVAVLGPNGAGKTTLLMTIAGFLRPQAGSVRVGATTLSPGSARRMNRAGVVLVPDRRALFTQLSPVENLLLAAHRRRGRVEEVLDLFPALRIRAKVRAGALSGGEQQMVAVGRALVQDPKVLLIDEMSMGLAPTLVEELMPLIRRIAADSGAAVVLVEQHVQLALETADRAVVLVHGTVVAEGPAEQLRRDPARLEAAYMGQAPAST